MILILFIVIALQREFKLVKQEVDSQTKEYEEDDCLLIEIKTNNKSALLDFTYKQGISDVLISDRKFERTCNQANIQNYCHQHNGVCEYLPQPKSTQYKIDFCSEKVYLYVQASLQKSKFNIRVIETNEQCIDHLMENQMLYCQSINVQQCKSTCVIGCEYLDCNPGEQDKKEYCVSNEMYSSRRLEKCKHDSLEESKVESLCSDKKEYIKSFAKSTNIFMDLLIFGLLIWCFSICYYRIYLSVKGRQPFDPGCCPQICYPKEPEF